MGVVKRGVVCLGFGFMDVANKEGVDFIVGNGPHYMIDGKKVGVVISVGVVIY